MTNLHAILFFARLEDQTRDSLNTRQMHIWRLQFVNFMKQQEKYSVEICFTELTEVKNIFFFRQSNTAKGAARLPDSSNYWILKKLDIHSRITKSMEGLETAIFSF